MIRRIAALWYDNRRTFMVALVAMLGVYSVVGSILHDTYVPHHPNVFATGSRVVLDRTHFAPMTAFAVTIRNRRSIFEQLAFQGSPVELWEDNTVLGPAGSTINDIVSLGKGRFRFERGEKVGATLTFSSSDNTDPMTNGRTYSLLDPTIRDADGGASNP